MRAVIPPKIRVHKINASLGRQLGMLLAPLSERALDFKCDAFHRLK
jgi:hypothetical protein